MSGRTPADQDVPLSPEEREELHWLRLENELLRTERDVLLRVATGFATDATRR